MYKITDQDGRHLDGGQTRHQVVSAVQRLLSDNTVKLPRLPKVGQCVVIALPVGKYLGVNVLKITTI